MQRRDALVRKLTSVFPGDARTGVLAPENEGTWDSFADHEQADAACPVLDPVSGRCDLYDGRPLTCRIFGPPVRQEEGVGVCELCYSGASRDDLFAGEVHLDHVELEEELNLQLPATETIIAWALLPQPDSEAREPGMESFTLTSEQADAVVRFAAGETKASDH